RRGYRIECPLLALSGHGRLHCTCPLSGAKRTCCVLVAGHAHAIDAGALTQGLEARTSCCRAPCDQSAGTCDRLRASDAPLPCPLTLIPCACERFAGTSDGVSMTSSCRRDIPSNCAFSSIARER